MLPAVYPQLAPGAGHRDRLCGATRPFLKNHVPQLVEFSPKRTT